MSRRQKLWALGIAGVLLGALVSYASNPLRRSDEALHRWLLERVPIGSELDHLKMVIERDGWRLNGTWRGNELHADWGGIHGDTIAWVYLGHYRIIFRTDLDSFWAFDESGHLIDVRTRRMTDAL